MDELINQLTTQLGIDPAAANQAVGMVLALLKTEGGNDLFEKLSASIPGAQASANAAPTPNEISEGGLLGSVMGMLGGSAGKGLSLVAALKALGIDQQQLAPFANIVLDFIKRKAGSDVVDQLLAKLPILKSLIA